MLPQASIFFQIKIQLCVELKNLLHSFEYEAQINLCSFTLPSHKSIHFFVMSYFKVRNRLFVFFELVAQMFTARTFYFSSVRFFPSASL